MAIIAPSGGSLKTAGLQGKRRRGRPGSVPFGGSNGLVYLLGAPQRLHPKVVRVGYSGGLRRCVRYGECDDEASAALLRGKGRFGCELVDQLSDR
jgi:hypothetical protein